MPVLTKINTNVIADNAITAAKTASSAEEESGLGLNTAATADLSGTISTQQFKLADAFTLTGDLTVNDDLILGKVRDDGTGQTLTHTAATNRTLTGTGTLTMGNYIEGQQVGVDVTTRVEGLTGTLGSGVNLDSVTFPAGHVIQVVSSSSSAYGSTDAQVYQLGHRQAITPHETDSKILISITSNFRLGRETNNEPVGYCAIWKDSVGTLLIEATIQGDIASTNIRMYDLMTLTWLDTTSNDGSSIDYGIAIKTANTSTVMYFDDGGPCTVTLMEISG